MKYSKTLVFLTLTLLIGGIPSANAAGELFFTSGGQPRFFGGPTVLGQIQRVNTDGTGQTVIIADTLAASGANRPHGIAVDFIGGKIYYTNWRGTPVQGLHFADLDGSNPGSISIGSGFFHTGIAIDNAGGKLYTTSSSRLQIANLDGTGVQTFFGGFRRGEVELDLANGHVYWTEDGLIRRANLDGTGITLIANIGFSNQPRGLEIDSANNTIYFTTNPRFRPGRLTTLRRIDLNGANQAILLALGGPGGPSGFGTNFFVEVELDPTTNQLYFTDTDAGTISRINTDGTGLTTILSGLDTPDGLDFVGVDARLDKTIVSGPDVDANTEIDVVVEVGQTFTTEYDFDIAYTNPGGPDVLVVDTAPAEWDVTEIEGNNTGLPVGPNQVATFVDGFGTVDVFRTGKGAKSKSSTKILWTPDPNGGTINVVATTRQGPGKKNVKFAPTSCGALYLNEDGAAAFELDLATGEPLRDPVTGEKLPPILESEGICLAAVSDVNGDGLIARDGSGDEDGDGLTDLEEACVIGTNPCLVDTDNDGVNDNLDACPLEGPPNPALGELQDATGCIRQSQCSDGIDNDNDGPIDFAGGDQSCNDILDDSEDTNDNPLTDCVNANGLLWCFNNDACGEACNDVCAAKGLTPVADSNVWFAAQNTVAKCQVIANALGGFTAIQHSSFAFACLEDVGGTHSVGGGLLGPQLICSTFTGCPDNHRTNMDNIGIACGVNSRRSICPCE